MCVPGTAERKHVCSGHSGEKKGSRNSGFLIFPKPTGDKKRGKHQ